MSGRPKINELAAESLRIKTCRRQVRINDTTEETEQSYLTIEGSPDGFRWLSNHLASLAKSAEQHSVGVGNIVAAWDFQNVPINLDGWNSIDFHCKN